MKRRYARFAMMPHALLDACHDARAFHLYAWLDRFADREGRMRRPIGELATQLQTSQRSVERAVATLRTCGAIQIERERRADGTLGRSSIWLSHRATGGGQVQTATGGGVVQGATGGGLALVQTATGGGSRPPRVAAHKEIQIKDLPDKNIQAGVAENAPPLCVWKRLKENTPTEPQLWEFLKGLWHTETFETIADFNDAARYHASQLTGFDWDLDVPLFDATFNKFLSAVDAGRIRRAR